MALLGLEAKLYINAEEDPTNTEGTWNEWNNVQDLVLNMSRTDADVSTRGGAGWEQRVATNRAGSIEFKTFFNASDARQTQVSDRFFSATSGALNVLVMSGDRTTAAGANEGLLCWVDVFQYNVGQQLQEGQGIDVILRPTLVFNSTGVIIAPSWVASPYP